MQENKNQNNEEQELDINHLMQIRREKLTEISKVCNPYPDRFEKTHSLKDAKKL